MRRMAMILKAINMMLLFCFLTGMVMLGSTPCRAETQYKIQEMTPEVQAALDGRKARYEELRTLKDKRIIGENNHGYVEVLSDDQGAKALVEAENKDRKFIYKTIEQQNNLTDAMETIEKVF